MTTFRDEYSELVFWLKAEHEKLDALHVPIGLTLDGEYTERSAAISREYRKKLRELKAKYNML